MLFFLLSLIGLIAIVLGLLWWFVWRKHKTLTISIQDTRSNASIRPRDGLGNAVDWYVVFKLPSSKEMLRDCATGTFNCPCGDASGACDTPHNDSGQCYFYADSNHPQLVYYTELQFDCLNGANNPLTQTMGQLSAGTYAIWNDQPIEAMGHSCSAPRAHSKGVICYNSGGGFVMNTSTPHWPNLDGQPIGCQSVDNSLYAQHFFCYSLSADSIASWVQAASAAALCLDKSSDASFSSLSTGGTTPAAVSLQTLDGVPLTLMVKGSEDVYSPWSLVSATLRTPLDVASWTAVSFTPTGWGTADKYSGSESLTQIVEVDTPKGCFASVYGKSHSKWAISTRGKWVIFGDMNQQDSQAKRGGTFISMQNDVLWESLQGFIGQTVPRG